MSDELRQREKELAQRIRKPANVDPRFEVAAQKFFEANPDLLRKYGSNSLIASVVLRMQLPSVVSAQIGFNQLVQEGLKRTDGGNESTDRAESAEDARASVRRLEAEVAANPLTKEDLDYFSSLSPRQISVAYYGEDGSAINEFAIRYRAAAKLWGFRLPDRYNDTPPAPDWAEGLV